MKQNTASIDYAKMSAVVDLSTNKVLVVKDGQVIEVEPPASGYGNQVAVWLGGKVDRVECMESRKI